MTIPCSEGGLVDVFILYPYLVVPWPNIYFLKYLGILQLIKEIIDPLKMILVLNSHFVQLSEKDAQSQCPIFLFHEQDWSTPR
jgi:hypothetical protein